MTNFPDKEQAEAAPQLRPARVEYVGPEGWRIWVDEDGTHVRANPNGCLEDADFRALIRLWEQADSQRGRDRIPAPRVPSREELIEQRRRRDDSRAAKQIARAIHSALGIEEGE